MEDQNVTKSVQAEILKISAETVILYRLKSLQSVNSLRHASVDFLFLLTLLILTIQIISGRDSDEEICENGT